MTTYQAFETKSKYRGLTIVILFLLCFTSLAHAGSLTVTVDDLAQIEESDAVINSVLSYAHPPLKVKLWKVTGASAQSTNIDVGNGEHGAFNASTAVNFHYGTYNNDKIIRINTDLYPELNFTSFELPATWKIVPLGTKPLIIRSLSDVLIGDEINCSGENGSVVGALNSTPSGGTGKCSGASGGRGGSTTGMSQIGSSPLSNTAGGGSPGANEGHGGGGGAGMITVNSATQPTMGRDLTDTTDFSNAGTAIDDPAFITSSDGGAGGGGGGEFTDNSDPTALSSGGGGGAGGGSILIFALGDVEVTASGQLLANGGNGGGTAGSGKGGAGGGGAGGSIQIFAGGDFVNAGLIKAEKGIGGTSSGGRGGTGGDGRIWIADKDNPSGGAGIDPYFFHFDDLGTITYQTGSFSIVSKTLDLGSSGAEITDVALDATYSNPSSVSIEVAVSEREFTAAEANWLPLSSLEDTLGRRYARIKITVNNQSETNPAIVRSVSLTYNNNFRGDFEFSSCALVKSNSPTLPGLGAIGLIMAIMLMPLLLALKLRLHHSKPSSNIA